MNDGFYRAFEERYYAPRDVIKNLRTQYLMFTDPVTHAYPGGATFDIGCGRGEWIELMRDSGMQPQGVDLDEGMLQASRERGLPVLQGDAVVHLATLPNASQVIVTAFHVVEHLEFEQLRTVVREALRVLVPGGLLIMETPNPENITVATNGFYLDPTHKRPIPRQLLEFLSEYEGFARVKVLRLQESPTVVADPAPDLLTVLRGVSPDYAVIAQNDGPEELLDSMRPLFEREYGLSLETLAGRYQLQVESRANACADRASRAEQRATDAERRATEAEERAIRAVERVTDAEQRTIQAEERASRAERRATDAERRATQAEERAGQAERRATAAEQRASLAEERAMRKEGDVTQAEVRAALAEAGAGRAEDRANEAAALAQQAAGQLRAVYESGSWRITAPLRFMVDIARRPGRTSRRAANHAIHRTINAFERPLSGLMKVVLRHPPFSERIGKWLRRYPALNQQLLDVARRNGVIQETPKELPAAATQEGAQVSGGTHLTYRARQIYLELNAAIAGKERQE